MAASREHGPEADLHPSLRERRVVHIDMDAFYASVEVRDNPALAGQPIVVGGTPEGRGVVATASYEARRFGIHSAMPAARARRLCPHAVFLRPRMEAYREAARAIRGVFQRYTRLVEPLSLDEAYLDVTHHARAGQTATGIARCIKADILEETRLTASAGVAPNKMLAKIASDLRKPDGLSVVRPEAVARFMETLPVAKISGVGKVTAARLLELGVSTCGEGLRLSRGELEAVFGRHGPVLYDRFRGLDRRPVEPERAVKSVGHEDTFQHDTGDLAWIRRFLTDTAERVAARLRRAGKTARTIVLKARYADFTTITRSATLPDPTDDADRIARAVIGLLSRTEIGPRRVRLLGISASNLEAPQASGRGQLLLFEL